MTSNLVIRKLNRGVYCQPSMVGRRLLHYEIVEQLGQGGMGVIYKARDTHLERLIAIKVLPPDKTADVERKRRFVQEARAASALNHPNIVTIHDIASDGGVDFIAMEFLAGKGLDQSIPSGGLPSSKVLRYTVQIASALAKAHSAGIVHRDLKPANIMIGPGDHVKVLDFGLAKLTEVISDTYETKVTESSTDIASLTEGGMIIGTASYMSPEQAEGKPVDGRSDIFSFGVVMYEMITGHRAFREATIGSTIAAILRDEPKPVSGLVPGVPRDLERVVARCLRKDPDRRYQTMADLKVALEDLKQESDSGKLAAEVPAARVSSKLSKRRAFFAASGVLVTLAAAGGLFWHVGKNEAVHTPPEIRRVTFDSGLAFHPALSPDGKYVAYASDRAGEHNLDIWVQAWPTGEPVRLTKDAANEDYPSFSSDGTKVAFESERDGGGIYSVPVLGGEPKLLARNGSRPRYSPDGQWLSFTPRNPGKGQQTDAVFLVPAEGGELTELRMGLVTSSHSIWSPDGSRLLYAGLTDSAYSKEALFQPQSNSMAWYVDPVPAGQPVRIEPSVQFARFLPASPLPLAWLKGNRILFSYASGDANNLWVATLSSDFRRIVGAPHQVTFGTDRIVDVGVANNGSVAFTITAARPRLWNIPLGTREAESKSGPIAEVTSHDFVSWPSLSDTGKLAYLSQRADKKVSLWLRELSSGKERLLASMEGDMGLVSAYIDHTGTQLAYTTWHKSKPAIYTIEAEGGTPEKICDDCGQLRSWLPGKRVMLSQEPAFEGSKWAGYHINRIDAVSGRKTVLLEKRGVILCSPDLSPDGHWIAFQAKPSALGPREQLLLAPMSDSGPVEPERWVPITELKYFDADPVFSRDGKTIYFTSDRDGFTCLWSIRMNLATGRPVGDPLPVKHFHGNPQHYNWYPVFGVGPDRIVISLEQVQSDLWMMQLPQ